MKVLGRLRDAVGTGSWLYDAFATMTVLALISIPITAWMTHVIVTINAEKYLLLLAGAVFFPIGIVHGIGIWLGYF